MQYIFAAIVFLFGAAVGSFINVVADRFNTGLPWWKGRSFCFSCNHILGRKDLFPLFSFLFLKGRCRYCGSKIPTESLLIEICMGILSTVAAFKTSLELRAWSLEGWVTYVVLTAIFAVILLVSIYDLRHFIIPDAFLIWLFIFALSSKLLAISSHTLPIIFKDLISGFILALPFLLIFIFSKGRWMGLGDVKYIAVLGFLLGFAGGVSAVVVAFWIGAVFSLMALSLKKLKPQINLPLIKSSLTIKSEIPFGPFLSLGIILSFCFNADIFQIHSLLNVF